MVIYNHFLLIRFAMGTDVVLYNHFLLIRFAMGTGRRGSVQPLDPHQVCYGDRRGSVQPLHPHQVCYGDRSTWFCTTTSSSSGLLWGQADVVLYNHFLLIRFAMGTDVVLYNHFLLIRFAMGTGRRGSVQPLLRLMSVLFVQGNNGVSTLTHVKLFCMLYCIDRRVYLNKFQIHSKCRMGMKALKPAANEHYLMLKSLPCYFHLLYRLVQTCTIIAISRIVFVSYCIRTWH